MLLSPESREGRSIWALKQMQTRKWFTSIFEYTIAMKKFTYLGRWDIALDLWDELNERGIDPDEVAYSAAIGAITLKRDDPNKVKELVREMELTNVIPTRFGCEQALRSFRRRAMWEDALNMLDTTWKCKSNPDEVIYQLTIDTCENAGRDKIAADLFKQMRGMNEWLWLQDQEELRKPSRPPPMAAYAPWRVPGSAEPAAFHPPKWHPKFEDLPKPSEEELRAEAVAEENWFRKEEGYNPRKLPKKKWRIPWKAQEKNSREYKQKVRQWDAQQERENQDPAWKRAKRAY